MVIDGIYITLMLVNAGEFNASEASRGEKVWWLSSFFFFFLTITLIDVFYFCECLCITSPR